MRKWVSEGRVSADSLVWREGWPDWKNAGSLFTELGGGQTAAVPPQPAHSQPAGPQVGSSPSGPGVPALGSAPARTYARRRSNNSLAVILVVLLTLASLGLFAILIAVVQFMQ